LFDRQVVYETEELFYVHHYPPNLEFHFRGLMFYAVKGHIIRLGKWLSMNVPCRMRTIYSTSILQQNIFITGEGEIVKYI